MAGGAAGSSWPLGPSLQCRGKWLWRESRLGRGERCGGAQGLGRPGAVQRVGRVGDGRWRDRRTAGQLRLWARGEAGRERSIGGEKEVEMSWVPLVKMSCFGDSWQAGLTGLGVSPPPTDTHYTWYLSTCCWRSGSEGLLFSSISFSSILPFIDWQNLNGCCPGKP